MEMGDRCYLELNCAYCNHLNRPENEIYPAGVYYAPTCGSDTFICEKCNKKNFITSNFVSKKIEDATLDDVRAGFEMATTISRTKEEIDRICKEHLKDLRR
jgi:hypothetical protein